ncbi:MAG TPA: tRNA lysidine(34) synthetase TilS [Verrucomicrobiae bacterium]
MSELPDLVYEAIRSRRLLARGARVLVAVSGGLDSIVLLHLLHHLSGKTGWRLVVGHLNHKLRGNSSNADERLVRRTAETLGLPAIIARRDVRALSRKEKVSLEMAARAARHAFLARAARRVGARVIALAHHADDQLELFFLRLLRGSGGQGLAGMRWKSRSPSARSLDLVRPLLAVSKSTLREYARRQRIEHREDASNASPDILRNRVRHHLLPLLQRNYQPALAQVISRTADILGAESEFVESTAAEWLYDTRPRTGTAKRSGGSRIRGGAANPQPFDQLHVSVQRRCLQAQLIALRVAPDFELVEKLRLNSGVPVQVGSRAGKADRIKRAAPASNTQLAFSVLREPSGRVQLQAGIPAPRGFTRGSLTLDVTPKAGAACFGGVEVRWRNEKRIGLRKVKRLVRKELFDADRVGSPVSLRHWQPGDRFQPIGMAGAVKLQDFFTNQKVPRKERQRLVLATTAQGKIFWIEGMRIAEQFKLSPKTIRRLHWVWRRP